MKFLALLVFAILVVVCSQAQITFKRTYKLMGSRFEITVVAGDTAEANYFAGLAVDEITRIERLISEWDSNSQTSAINRQAGIQPVAVDQELFDLIERAIGFSKLTDGAFDISFAAMNAVWNFDGSMTAMPSEAAIRKSVAWVGYEHIELDKASHKVFLREKNMKIGFGAIGKGYAADKAKALLLQQGVQAGIINASGDMSTWGKQPGGMPWTVAITNPLDKNKAFGLVALSDRAVASSGDYEKFVVFNGIRYTHIIDPRTGYPARGIRSVTIFAPSAELADALATAVFVMGVEAGLNRVNQIPHVECIVIDEEGALFKTDTIQIDKL